MTTQNLITIQTIRKKDVDQLDEIGQQEIKAADRALSVIGWIKATMPGHSTRVVVQNVTTGRLFTTSKLVLIRGLASADDSKGRQEYTKAFASRRESFKTDYTQLFLR